MTTTTTIKRGIGKHIVFIFFVRNVYIYIDEKNEFKIDTNNIKQYI
jgi:hypothetical protein